MNFGWGPESYAVPFGNPNVEPAYLSTSTPLVANNANSRYALQKPCRIDAIQTNNNHSLSFADAMSAFTNQDPADYKHDPANYMIQDTTTTTTMHPMNMFSSQQDPPTSPSVASSRHDSAQASSATPKTTPTGTEATELFDNDDDEEAEKEEQEQPLKFESETTHRARYAANQRHAKARNSQQQQQASNTTNPTTSAATAKATEKKQVLREKNKVAAAKCRQRQRKQAETIRAKGSRLSETNAQLKSYVQELRGELNGLRAVALGHGDCDERLARYNHVQAERVMRDYYSACGGLAGSMMGGVGVGGGREQASRSQ
jgi:hypothetical protein